MPGQRAASSEIPAPDPEPPPRAQQQADVRALLAETARYHALHPGAPAERYQVVVHLDAAVLGDLDSSALTPTPARLMVRAQGGRAPC